MRLTHRNRNRNRNRHRINQRETRPRSRSRSRADSFVLHCENSTHLQICPPLRTSRAPEVRSLSARGQAAADGPSRGSAQSLSQKVYRLQARHRLTTSAPALQVPVGALVHRQQRWNDQQHQHGGKGKSEGDGCGHRDQELGLSILIISNSRQSKELCQQLGVAARLGSLRRHPLPPQKDSIQSLPHRQVNSAPVEPPGPARRCTL